MKRCPARYAAAREKTLRLLSPELPPRSPTLVGPSGDDRGALEAGFLSRIMTNFRSERARPGKPICRCFRHSAWSSRRSIPGNSTCSASRVLERQCARVRRVRYAEPCLIVRFNPSVREVLRIEESAEFSNASSNIHGVPSTCRRSTLTIRSFLRVLSTCSIELTAALRSLLKPAIDGVPCESYDTSAG